MTKILKIIKSRNLKKDRQHNDRTSKYKMNNNDPRNSTQKLQTKKHEPH